MKVKLAGYNVDADVLEEMQAESGRRDNLTPETFSAAYARISRDPRPIDEIRQDAKEEVGRARRSNETIIFKMGHHSVAEHAVFNFDIIGVSRYAMEAVEKFRLCSYTEKSQRYITLADDFVIPSEIIAPSLKNDFIQLIHQQNELYHDLYAYLKEYVFETYRELAASPKNITLLEGWAKEDARYVTALATEAQVGMTINARNLELMLRRFASHPLTEVRTLGRMIYEQVKEIAPSIIIFHEANDFDEKTYPELSNFAHTTWDTAPEGVRPCDGGTVELMYYDSDGDMMIGAALLHRVSHVPFAECMQRVDTMNRAQKQELFKTACRHLQLYDTLLREYEYASLTYEMIVSAACFGQLKRHRMTTITTQSYDPRLGITIPESIKAIGKESECRAIIAKTNDLYYQIQQSLPHVAPYILTNAHQRRVLLRTNVRELYHISRLREDEHAQWDVRQKARLMSEHAQRVMPLACLLMGGKDSFAETYECVYGTAPPVKEPLLPGIRKIQ